MNKFINLIERAERTKSGNFYGVYGHSFDKDDPSIELFVNALKSVANVSSINVSKPNKYGVVVVSYEPKSAIAEAICTAISFTLIP